MPGNTDKHAPVLSILCCARRIHVHYLRECDLCLHMAQTTRVCADGRTRGFHFSPQPLKLGSSPLKCSKGARVLELWTYRDGVAGTLAAFSIRTVCCVTLPKPNPHPPSLGNTGT